MWVKHLERAAAALHVGRDGGESTSQSFTGLGGAGGGWAHPNCLGRKVKQDIVLL